MKSRKIRLLFEYLFEYYMMPYCFWSSLGSPAGDFWVVNEEETIGLKIYRDIIHLGMLKYISGNGEEYTQCMRHSPYTYAICIFEYFDTSLGH